MRAIRPPTTVERDKLVLAVFVAKAYAERLKRNEPLYEPQVYAKAAKQRDVTLYYFTVDDMRGSGRRREMWGWSFTGQQWTYSQVPWPHLVYDQVIDPEGEEKKAVSQVRRSSSFSWLSPRNGLPKWLTHEILSKYSSLVGLLPEERRLTSVDDLAHMLSRHNSVLVKPNYGSRGRGITMIWRETADTYGLHHSGEEEIAKGLTLQEAYSLASNYAGDDYLVVSQQIPLLRIGNSLTDIRIIMGKSLQGDWYPVLSIMRVGKEGSFVTNWSMGAQEVPLAQGLEAAGLPPARVDALVNQVLEVSFRLANVLEAGRGHLIEIGLDLAFDTNLRLWFIEANASPGKEAEDANSIPPYFACIIDGALYLWNSRQQRRSRSRQYRRRGRVEKIERYGRA